MSTMNPAYWWHALNLITWGNLLKYRHFIEKMGGPEAFFCQKENQLLAAGLDPSGVDTIIAGKKRINPEEEWKKLHRLGIKTLCIGDPDYPELLAQIHTAPPILYIRGNIKALAHKTLGIVGSRKMSTYGKQAIESLVPQLVDFGVAIVSGMAFGVDAAALQTCVDCKGTPVAVLASSLEYNKISPQSNLPLAHQIEKTGCILSETPPGLEASKAAFPRRNRIISGLSLGTLVVEAAMESGSLITAKFALDQNREVFAVPGSIFSQSSAGTLELIKRGAKCVTRVQDIAFEFGWDIGEHIQAPLFLGNPVHQKIYEYIKQHPAPASVIVTDCQISAEDVMSALTELEISGIIKRGFNGEYAKIN